jgi:hypothetical protein
LIGEIKAAYRTQKKGLLEGEEEGECKSESSTFKQWERDAEGELWQRKTILVCSFVRDRLHPEQKEVGIPWQINRWGLDHCGDACILPLLD